MERKEAFDVQQIHVNGQIWDGEQLSKNGIRQLAMEGSKTVVNLRAGGEEDQPRSPDAAGKELRELRVSL